MRYLRRPKVNSRSIAIFCGAFDPPTVAHLALAEAARQQVDEVMWVMPESFPHKRYEGLALPGRLRMILEASHDAVAVSHENLFFAIAEEARLSLPGRSICLLIGEDGARRIVEWNYGFDAEGHERYLTQNLSECRILTTQRQGEWRAPDVLAPYFDWLKVDQEIVSISSTLVRERIAAGKDWEHLVPPGIVAKVWEFYGSDGRVKGQ